jgi:hypothetical protein
MNILGSKLRRNGKKYRMPFIKSYAGVYKLLYNRKDAGDKLMTIKRL